MKSIRERRVLCIFEYQWRFSTFYFFVLSAISAVSEFFQWTR